MREYLCICVFDMRLVYKKQFKANASNFCSISSPALHCSCQKHLKSWWPNISVLCPYGLQGLVCLVCCPAPINDSHENTSFCNVLNICSSKTEKYIYESLYDYAHG